MRQALPSPPLSAFQRPPGGQTDGRVQPLPLAAADATTAVLRVVGPIAVLFIQSSISLDIQLFGHVDGQVVCVFASPALLLAEHEAPSSISGERACV